MTAGQLSERVRFERPIVGADGMGGGPRTWAEVETVWAMVMPLKGDEQIEHAKLTAKADYKIKLRRRGDLSADMRVIWATGGNLVMNLRYIEDPGPRGEFMWLTCESGVAV